jgi:hypothetical protein
MGVKPEYSNDFEKVHMTNLMITGMIDADINKHKND